MNKSPLPEKLAAPTKRALAGAEIDSLEKLASFSEQDLAELHGIGPNALATLKKALSDNRLSLRK